MGWSIDKGQNISDGDGMQLTAMSAEDDNSLIHFIVLAFINHFGIGEHLECRFPAKNSFNLLVVSWLSPLNLHVSLTTRVLDLNFCSVSLSSHMILGSHGQSSQSCGTKFVL